MPGRVATHPPQPPQAPPKGTKRKFEVVLDLEAATERERGKILRSAWDAGKKAFWQEHPPPRLTLPNYESLQGE